jgi:hypothetical protein
MWVDTVGAKEHAAVKVDPKTGMYLGGDAIEFYRRLKG